MGRPILNVSSSISWAGGLRGIRKVKEKQAAHSQLFLLSIGLPWCQQAVSCLSPQSQNILTAMPYPLLSLKSQVNNKLVTFKVPSCWVLCQRKYFHEVESVADGRNGLPQEKNPSQLFTQYQVSSPEVTYIQNYMA